MDKKNLLLFICTVLSFFTVFAVNAVTIVIPSIATEFHMSNIVQNWVTIIFLLVVAVLSVPAGQISAKYGLKKVTIISVVLFIIISIANVLVTSQEQFLACRLILGIALSFINVTSMAMIVNAFPPEERGKALGINITGVYVGLSLSPVIGGILNYNLGWRSVVLFGVPFLFVILALLLTRIDDEWSSFENLPLDLKGSFAYGIGMVLFMYGFTILNTQLGVILTVLGVMILLIFAWIELKQKYPVFDIRFFKNHKFLSANFASLCAYLATYAVTTILNYHLQYIKGFDSQTAGMILLVAPLCQVILAPIAGRLSDRFVPQILAAIGMALGTLSLFLFSFLDSATSIEFLFVAMILYGIGFGLFSPPNTNVIMGSVPPKDTSVASAAVATMRTVGQAMSMGILTLVFAFVMGDVPIIQQYYPLLIQSCQITCIICVVLCIASVFASFVGIKSDS
ncbi:MULTISPECIES: MFS transporter [unclassified Methanobrevibacter]|uniref:MFS transporter n=1 Tax=unclassified Methanobrevibacter TaxID=2638681 RepID=UPI0025D3950E|nr:MULTISPECIES: MFS transporter [unclassified Methanobrevibacter]MEE0941629.1 MFS transporter [Methanobrevibacter sp.]